ncbi:T6SS immunity protein Tli4 family protein [Robbsia andropogonis]|uniref:T6SS immunity protein Tli4 family protein n=1 Tax=Robbsia andropogonis TaxID=28092 RepID=UPI000467E99D|nr:T6SS immunity protein Tli4 family protein [Robbsia andropogonis]MCP1118951.1 T6SS immunity protein Tli4 family protein [Robbsia andropogonis]MCP1128697.1 T6SS immunity protein Tli4 family protein [Robbsia andropogonis]
MKFPAAGVALVIIAFTQHLAASQISSPLQHRFGRFSIDLPSLSVVRVNATYLGVEVRGPSPAVSLEKFKDGADSEAAKYDQSGMKVDQIQTDIFKAGGLDPNVEFGKKQLVQYRFDSVRSESFIAYHPTPRTSDTTARLTKLTSDGIYDFEQADGSASMLNQTYAELTNASIAFKRYKDADSMPVHAFCIANGCFDDGAKQNDRETAKLSASLGPQPGPELSIVTNAKVRADQDDNNIETRADDEILNLERTTGHVTVLRRGYRSIVGQRGFEVGVSIESPGHPPAYVFVWASAGELHNPMKPIIDFDLRIMPTEDGMSMVKKREEAEHIWDSLVQSFHAR